MIRRACRITSKGQVTVPREIRIALGLKPGEYLEFRLEGGVATVQPKMDDTPDGKKGRPSTDSRYDRIFAASAIKRFNDLLERP